MVEAITNTFYGIRLGLWGGNGRINNFRIGKIRVTSQVGLSCQLGLRLLVWIRQSRSVICRSSDLI